MSTVTVQSTRFGTLEVAETDVIEFPAGLIGLGGRRFAILEHNPDSAFGWLQSLEDDGLALPVTTPWEFFPSSEVELSDEDTERLAGHENPTVLVTVRAGSELSDFSANLRAPIVIAHGRGFQVINEASDAPVRAALFAGAQAEPQAA